MLCKYCTDFDLDALDSIDGYHHHNSVRSLQESASNGCKSCILIRTAHREHEGGSLDDSWCGSGEDSEITMHMADFGMIEVSQTERRKSNSRPFLVCVVHSCTQAGGYDIQSTEVRMLKSSRRPYGPKDINAPCQPSTSIR
jgi:hypothetical protein